MKRAENEAHGGRPNRTRSKVVPLASTPAQTEEKICSKNIFKTKNNIVTMFDRECFSIVGKIN